MICLKWLPLHLSSSGPVSTCSSSHTHTCTHTHTHTHTRAHTHTYTTQYYFHNFPDCVRCRFYFVEDTVYWLYCKSVFRQFNSIAKQQQLIVLCCCVCVCVCVCVYMCMCVCVCVCF